MEPCAFLKRYSLTKKKKKKKKKNNNNSSNNNNNNNNNNSNNNIKINSDMRSVPDPKNNRFHENINDRPKPLRTGMDLAVIHNLFRSL